MAKMTKKPGASLKSPAWSSSQPPDPSSSPLVLFPNVALLRARPDDDDGVGAGVGAGGAVDDDVGGEEALRSTTLVLLP